MITFLWKISTLKTISHFQKLPYSERLTPGLISIGRKCEVEGTDVCYHSSYTEVNV